MPPRLYPLPLEGLNIRDPEWQELERGYGQGPSEGRVVLWDPIHGWIKKEGPTMLVTPPIKPY